MENVLKPTTDRKEYQREYYHKNSVKIRAYQKQYFKTWWNNKRKEMIKTTDNPPPLIEENIIIVKFSF
jgi:hypothetical protein